MARSDEEQHAGLSASDAVKIVGAAVAGAAVTAAGIALSKRGRKRDETVAGRPEVQDRSALRERPEDRDMDHRSEEAPIAPGFYTEETLPKPSAFAATVLAELGIAGDDPRKNLVRNGPKQARVGPPRLRISQEKTVRRRVTAEKGLRSTISAD